MLAVDRRAIARHRESYSAEVALKALKVQLQRATELDRGNIMHSAGG